MLAGHVEWSQWWRQGESAGQRALQPFLLRCARKAAAADAERRAEQRDRAEAERRAEEREPRQQKSQVSGDPHEAWAVPPARAAPT